MAASVRRLLREHPAIVLPAVAIIAVGALTLVSYQAGFDRVQDALPHFHPGWLVLAAAGQVVGMAAYVIAYRHVVAHGDGPRISGGLAARLVAAGFGPVAVGGGFAFDRRALRNLCGDRGALVRVAALGALEWGLLAPAACACAIALLVEGARHIQISVLWSWIIAVPLGFAIALPIASPGRVKRMRNAKGWRRALGSTLEGALILRRFAERPHRSLAPIVGITVYWAADVASLYAGLRAFSLSPTFAQVVLAYATGYAATRRSLPLGGAGLTEVLLALSVHWLGFPLAAAIPGVAAYRLFNLFLPTVPALFTHGRLRPLLSGQVRCDMHGRPLWPENGDAVLGNAADA
jgi:uncharacterized membrane protein YbhN (UPF0104 family)